MDSTRSSVPFMIGGVDTSKCLRLYYHGVYILKQNVRPETGPDLALMPIVHFAAEIVIAGRVHSAQRKRCSNTKWPVAA